MPALANSEAIKDGHFPSPKNSKIVPVILCGGSGTRLWPLSRSQYPKQFCSLIGNESLFQQTVGRVLQNSLFEDSIIVANHQHRFLIEQEMKTTGVSGYRLLLEPCSRNTTPAVTLACLTALQQDPEAIVLVMPSDHLIGDKQEFLNTVCEGFEDANSGLLVTFGVVPTRPETGYGYIHYENNANTVSQKVIRFVEKPDIVSAEAYVSSKEYLWNSGIFLFKASTFIEAVSEYEPEILKVCRDVLNNKVIQYPLSIDKEVFKNCPSVSIDYGVMERSQDVKVIPLSTDWNDLGSWEALWDAADKDENGNCLEGDVIANNVENSYIRSEGRLVTVVGLDDVIVVESQDAVLVSSRSASQDVKKIVEALQSRDRPHTHSHPLAQRPWGTFQSVDKGERFQVKRITVNAGSKLSLQLHHHRAEHWIVVSGTAKVTKGEEEFLVFENESIYIPCGVQHRLENPGKIPLELIEVQSGSYLGEDDIVRLGDDYGRA
ncbi:MAG: mannose-1-phosphate guanylyltransferase/mannose-6-phosphate isomerase [Alphaproteobacteria bacterium]|nr:mannose-1-phosphate guanylyltransferase/mannose-6-phosphate isomerase [Alphaproteobacteria bacterium]